MDLNARKKWLERRAKALGFDFIGIAEARRLDGPAGKLEQWLKQGYHGKMAWMENHFEKRVDPRKLVPGARSVISLMYNYFPQKEQTGEGAPQIARYAFGEDYHLVIRKKLKRLLQEIRDEMGEINGRCFVDSAPVLERDWAEISGLGWKGKNTLLIHPKAGSYFFLAEIISDLELPSDHPINDHCGTCRKCIDACPTEAISPKGYVLDASKCISYLTIELREAIPDDFNGKMEDWAFGCDICQEVCPWNRFSSPHNEPAFEPSDELMQMDRRDWEEITEEVFDRIFKRSAVKRTKFEGLKRNLKFLRKA